MRKMKIGLQLYTLRDELAQDFEGTLRKVAAMGYEGVEFAGYGGLKAEQLRELLQELNLEPIGNHIGLQLLEEDLDGQIEYLQAIGAKYAAIPWIAPEEREAERWPGYIANFEAYGKRFLESGIQLTYHNHDFEFEVKLDGKPVFEALYEQTSEDSLKVEMDIGWVQYSGIDPVAYIGKYAGRLPLLHLKDFRQGEPGAQIDTVELGRGDLPLLPIIEAASEAGVEWLIVEQDACANPPLEAVAESFEWLSNNYLKSKNRGRD